jgi:hypothetical protein
MKKNATEGEIITKGRKENFAGKYQVNRSLVIGLYRRIILKCLLKK